MASKIDSNHSDSSKTDVLNKPSKEGGESTRGGNKQAALIITHLLPTCSPDPLPSGGVLFQNFFYDLDAWIGYKELQNFPI